MLSLSEGRFPSSGDAGQRQKYNQLLAAKLGWFDAMGMMKKIGVCLCSQRLAESRLEG